MVGERHRTFYFDGDERIGESVSLGGLARNEFNFLGVWGLTPVEESYGAFRFGDKRDETGERIIAVSFAALIHPDGSPNESDHLPWLNEEELRLLNIYSRGLAKRNPDVPVIGVSAPPEKYMMKELELAVIEKFG